MGKLAQIFQISKCNVILLKEEGYKNKKIASRLGFSKASVSRISGIRKMLLCLRWKGVVGLAKRHQGRTKKSGGFWKQTLF